MGMNRGEWSELYAFYKLVFDKKISVSDENLEKEIDSYKIREVYKMELSGNETIFFIDLDSEEKITLLKSDGTKVKYKNSRFKTEAEIILSSIGYQSTRERGAFSISKAEEFLEELKIKPKSPSGEKVDLEMKINDHRKDKEIRLGYSLKSQLGSPATLLNASAATNFRYKVKNLSEDQIREINSIQTREKLKDRYSKILEFGGVIETDGVVNDIFESNLLYIDGDLPKILSYLLLYSYTEDEKTIEKLVETLAKENPLNYPSTSYQPREYYHKKIGVFLEAVTFGMKPATPFENIHTVNGGIIVIKNDGKILLLDKIYYEENLKKYLMQQTKLDTPSSTRYGMMEIKTENGQSYFTLNLQVRFKN